MLYSSAPHPGCIAEFKPVAQPLHHGNQKVKSLAPGWIAREKKTDFSLPTILDPWLGREKFRVDPVVDNPDGKLCFEERGRSFPWSRG